MLGMQVAALKMLMVMSLAVGVFLFIRLLFPEEEAQEAKKRLGVGGVRTVSPSLIVKISRPLFVLLTPLTQNVKAERYRTRVRRGFITAGMTDEMSPDEFFAWKLVMGVFAPAFVSQMIGGMFNIPWYA